MDENTVNENIMNGNTESTSIRAQWLTFSRVMSTLALVVAAAALAVALLHAGPRGVRGPAGQAGPAGQQGPAGPAGLNAPTLSYECQDLFPNNSSNGTETTFYWPCTNNSNDG